MESLELGGISTVLFVGPPSRALLDRYRHVRAIGIAGDSRTMNPGEMDAELPLAYEALLSHGPAIVHYKTCSTFDSAPTTGSIGRAIDIGRQCLGNRLIPLVVGAPPLQRFCVFGNLFARSGSDSEPYRLDRHPTMKCHPVTPMDEADLRVHLSRQTKLPIELIDVLSLDNPDFDWRTISGDHDGIVLFDTLRDEHLLKIGRAISQMQQDAGQPLLVAGSSGVEYAMVKAWKASRIIADDFQWTRESPQKEQTLVVSGSCSPVTEQQIQWAIDRGFAEVHLNTRRLGELQSNAKEVERTVGIATTALKRGQSVIVHTCRGPQDERIRETQASAALLGETLAIVLKQSLAECPLRRVAVTGGDTSGQVARQLGIEALEMISPLAPGAPLCVARSSDQLIDGMEITFKGGQLGHTDFFGAVLRGWSASRDEASQTG